MFYRVIGPNGAAIDHALRVRDGAVHTGAHLVPKGSRRSLYGLAVPTRIDVDGVEVVLGPTVEDGPFYQRLVARVGGSVGFAEVVRADRLAWSVHRPFVRMAVHRERGPNSIWSPLFVGARRGRSARLLRWWAR